MESNENLTGIVSALYKKRKTIIGFTIITTLVVAGLSLLLPNYYKAETIFYAASPDLGKPSPMGVSQNKMFYYGTSEDIDRMLSLVQSSNLKKELVSKFNLYKHYEIDSSKLMAQYNVMNRLNKLYKVEKTKYDAISLSIEDKNPEMSKNMVNFARDFAAKKAQSLLKESQRVLIETSKSNLDYKKKTMEKSNNELDSLKNVFGIYDTKLQGSVIAELITTASGKMAEYNSKIQAYKSINNDSVRALQIKYNAAHSQFKTLQKQAKNFNKGQSKVLSIEKQLSEASDQLGIDNERYKMLKSAYDNDFRAVHVIEQADVPLRKSRPKRSILVIAACMATFFLSCFAVILFSFYKKVDWNEIIGDDS